MPGIKAKRKQLVRKTLMRAKAQSERPAEQRQESPEEYAQTEVQHGISDVAARTGNTAKSTARMSYRKFRAMEEKRKNLTLQGSTQSASKPTEKEKVTVPTQTERREMFKKKRFRQKAIAAKTPAPQAPVPSSATPAPPPYQAQMQQHLKRQHLTREAVRRYLQKQTATTAAGNTAPTHPSCPQSAVNKPRLKQSAVAFIISQPKSKPCSPKLCGTPRNRCWRCLVRAAWCCCWRWS